MLGEWASGIGGSGAKVGREGLFPHGDVHSYSHFHALSLSTNTIHKHTYTHTTGE